jgi:N-acetylglucosaminyldiphosphoundecaprenol N-acetyl-beta-D-mannosaminyltransferase
MLRLSNHSTILMKQSLLGINVSLQSYHGFVKELIELAKAKKSSYTCVANVHMLIEAKKDSDFAHIVNSAELCTPDGMPLVWALKALYGIRQERASGMDLLPDLLKEAEAEKIPVYFYGGTLEMISKSEEYIKNNFPELIVAGLFSPPFRPLSPAEEQETVVSINQSGAQLIFVSLGCPKQEKWMAAMQGRILAPMIGVGGALPVMVGLQKRAPVWAQNSGLEWVYRLFQEPRRLFKRYAITNTTFLWLLLKAKIRNSRRSSINNKTILTSEQNKEPA